MKIKGAATKTRRGQIKKFKKNISENWEVIVSVSERKSWLTLITVPSPLWAAQGMPGPEAQLAVMLIPSGSVCRAQGFPQQVRIPVPGTNTEATEQRCWTEMKVLGK